MHVLAADSLDYPEFIPDIDNYIKPNCRYLDIECISEYVNGVSLSILMLNIRSCCKNFDQFILTFCNFISYFTCIILTETWLTQDRDNVFDSQGFHCANLYRNNKGGGIKIYLKDSVQYEVLNRYAFVNGLFEMLTVELLYCSNKYLLSAIYQVGQRYLLC